MNCSMLIWPIVWESEYGCSSIISYLSSTVVLGKCSRNLKAVKKKRQKCITSFWAICVIFHQFDLRFPNTDLHYFNSDITSTYYHLLWRCCFTLTDYMDNKIIMHKILRVPARVRPDKLQYLHFIYSLVTSCQE